MASQQDEVSKRRRLKRRGQSRQQRKAMRVRVRVKTTPMRVLERDREALEKEVKEFNKTIPARVLERDRKAVEARLKAFREDIRERYEAPVKLVKRRFSEKSGSALGSFVGAFLQSLKEAPVNQNNSRDGNSQGRGQGNQGQGQNGQGQSNRNELARLEAHFQAIIKRLTERIAQLESVIANLNARQTQATGAMASMPPSSVIPMSSGMPIPAVPFSPAAGQPPHAADGFWANTANMAPRNPGAQVNGNAAQAGHHQNQTTSPQPIHIRPQRMG